MMRLIRIWWITHLLDDLARKQRAADAARDRLFRTAERWEPYRTLCEALEAE
jgi:hypothetical protein